jgi:hypothetical protein
VHDPEASEGNIGMWSPAAPQGRLSLRLRALLDSRGIGLKFIDEQLEILDQEEIARVRPHRRN